MKKIYPKTDSQFRGIRFLKKYIDKSKGVEIQLLDYNKKKNVIEIEETIESLLHISPNIKEVTIHLPNKICPIEFLALKGIDFIKPLLEDAKRLSIEHEIKINFLFHVYYEIELIKMTMLPFINDMLNIIKGYNVMILLENTYIVKNDKGVTAPIDICKFIGNKQLKACIDICHLHCSCNMHKKDIKEFVKSNFNKTISNKYVYQVHFSATLNNRGYFDLENTHGRKHETRVSLEEEIKILKDMGIEDKIFITEISEEDYNTRKEQIEEIEMLEDISQLLK
jgi:Endonuclease IV